MSQPPGRQSLRPVTKRRRHSSQVPLRGSQYQNAEVPGSKYYTSNGFLAAYTSMFGYLDPQAKIASTGNPPDDAFGCWSAAIQAPRPPTRSTLVPARIMNASVLFQKGCMYTPCVHMYVYACVYAYIYVIVFMHIYIYMYV